jgi:hypothetical protein
MDLKSIWFEGEELAVKISKWKIFGFIVKVLHTLFLFLICVMCFIWLCIIELYEMIVEWNASRSVHKIKTNIKTVDLPYKVEPGFNVPPAEMAGYNEDEDDKVKSGAVEPDYVRKLRSKGLV